MNNILQLAAQFSQNPIALLSQRYQIPEGLNNPQDIIQHLLNSKQVTQEQVNRAMSMRNDPRLQILMGGKR